LTEASMSGDKRPILNEKEGTEVMATLACDVLVKGGDWTIDPIIGREEVKATRSVAQWLSFSKGVSMTEIIDEYYQAMIALENLLKIQPYYINYWSIIGN
jgi:bifunctional ADP-heptose synthase (sugar kinase/adenylyltransferase)